MLVDSRLTNPKAIAEAGKIIYSTVQTQLETEHWGRFVAINIDTGQFFLGDTSDEALAAAHAANDGLCHLIRIGFPAAFGHASFRTGIDRLRR